MKQAKQTKPYNKPACCIKINQMKLNSDKSEVMLFSPCKTLDFSPKIKLSNKELDLVEKTKLLGIMISSDLSWEENTNYIVQRCNKRIWILRRLKRLGARRSQGV